jgi:predicted nucleotidyltransferase
VQNNYVTLAKIDIIEIMKLKDPRIRIIKEVAYSYFSDAEIMLFGSRAIMTATADSDYDILIVTNQFLKPEEKTPIRTQIRKDLLKAGVRSDILIQSQEEIRKKKELPGHIIRNILIDAVLL